MKYCKHCGAELLDEAVICPKCGCPTGDTNTVVTTPTNANAIAAPKPGLTVSIIGFVIAVVMTLFSWLLSLSALYFLATPVLVLGIIGCVYAARSLKFAKTKKGSVSLGLSIASLALLVLDFLTLFIIIILGINML